ncbi:uncharacterized protein LOC144108598 [Amblyomma americanum]
MALEVLTEHQWMTGLEAERTHRSYVESGRTGDIDHSSQNSEHVQSGTVTTATLPGHRRMPRTANAPSRRGGLSKGGDAVGAAVMEGSFSASPEGSPASTEVLSSDATSPAAALIGTDGIASAAAAALSVPGAQNVLAGIKSVGVAPAGWHT